MDAARWAEIRRCFETAVALPPAAREDWLARECADSATRAEVDAMLRADADARTSLSARAARLLDEVGSDATPPPDDSGARFGAWRLLRPLGEGGMGTVWLAERVEGDFTQRVALKRMRFGWDAGELARRFRQERQILAALEHPNIARLIDGGAGDGGEPFLALEYVEGIDLRTWCETGGLGLEARLRLFLTVCEAVAHAHSRLVVHRDLKPSNILVTQQGEVKLLDFGVAKLLDSTSASEHTGADLRLYTAGYAAPEQIRGEPCTTAVDVHALGVVLYELLAGRRPFDTARGVAAIELAALTQEPEPPSQAVTRPRERAADAATWPPASRMRLRGDLDAIVLRALRKPPGERYASVRAFADDVLAHLQRRPVLARRGTWRYRALRFAQRHALALLLAALAGVSLVGGLGAAVWQAREAATQRDAAAAQAETAEQTLAFMQDLFAHADPETAAVSSPSARELLEQGLQRIRDDLQDQPAVRARLLRAMGEAQVGLGDYAAAEVTLGESLKLARASGERAAVRASTLAYAHALGQLAREPEVIDLLQPLAEMTTAPDGDADIARLHELLGFAHYQQAEHARAEVHFRTALAHAERAYGLAHRRAQAICRGYVALLLARDRRDEALALAQRALDALPLRPDRADPLRASALSSLALAQAAHGKRDEVARLRAEELALVQRIVGDEHFRYFQAQNNLAIAYFSLGRHEEAGVLLEQAIAGYRRHLSPDHATLAHTLANASLNAARLGDARLALAHASEAVRIRRQRNELDSWGMAFAQQAMATALIDLGRIDEAAPVVEDVLRKRRRLYGADSGQLVAPLALALRVQLGREPVGACAEADEAQRILHREADIDVGREAYLRGLAAACRIARGDASATAQLAAAIAVLDGQGARFGYERCILGALRDRVRAGRARVPTRGRDAGADAAQRAGMPAALVPVSAAPAPHALPPPRSARPTSMRMR